MIITQKGQPHKGITSRPLLSHPLSSFRSQYYDHAMAGIIGGNNGGCRCPVAG